MLRWAGPIVLGAALCIPCVGQTGAITGFCSQGGTQAKTSGLFSLNYQQGIVPSCTVTVNLTGTTTAATLFADAIGTPLSNPFTASSAGQWTFWAAITSGYDVVLSGGVSPNTYTTTVKLQNLWTFNGSLYTTPSSGVAYSSGTGFSVATSTQMQTAIGSGVYDASGAAAARAATGTCASNQYTTATTTSGVTCAQVAYSQVSGTPSALPPNGTASGDLSGSYPSPTVAKINGVALPTIAAATGVLLDTAGVLTISSAPAISGANLTALPTTTSLYPTLNQNTTGTAANITATSNSTLLYLLAGNIGIGVASASAPLDIKNGSATASAVHAYFTNGASDPNFRLAAFNGAGSGGNTEQAWFGMPYAGSQTNAPGISFVRGGSSNGWMNFEANGGTVLSVGGNATTNVGIGTTSPGSLLEVNGAAKIDGVLTATSGLGPSSSTSLLWTTASGAPSGSCTSGSLYTNQSGTTTGTNNLYVCSQSTWVAVK